jgi:hypothetical protein
MADTVNLRGTNKAKIALIVLNRYSPFHRWIYLIVRNKRRTKIRRLLFQRFI